MVLALFSGLGLGRRQARNAAGRPGKVDRRFRLRMEGLEDRVTPATLGAPIDIDLNVVGQGANRTIEAVASVAGQAAEVVPLNLTTGSGTSQLLNLELGPIDLNLLGLGVQTSEICLDITATPAGGLLGQLLAGLGSGLNLGQIVSGLGGQLGTVVDGLNDVLDEALGAMTMTGAFEDGDVGTQQVGEDICNVLNLELGPVDLNLLGLGVHLDDCDDGPVTVDVTADPEGGLLGQLLCGLAGGIDLGGIDLDDLVGRVDDLIGRLGDLADQLGGLDELPDRVVRQIENVTDQLQRIADRVEDLGDLDRFADRLDRAIDRIDDILGRVGDISDRLVDRAERLVDQLGDLLNDVDDDADLDRIADRADRLLDRLGDVFDRLDDVADDRLVDRAERLLERLGDVFNRLDDVNNPDRLVDRAERLLERLGDVLGRVA
jgi:ABC-type transporter Mla subunit MlaD